MDIYWVINMYDLILETYDKEYSFLKSMKYIDERDERIKFSDLESSSLISDFHKLFFTSFEHQLNDKDKVKVFWEIDRFCIDFIKLEYARTKDLDILEFPVWHLSIFMIIQNFITITGSKYNLENVEKIKNLFNKLLKEDLYKFIKLNSAEFGVKNISNKLRKVIVEGNVRIVITETQKFREWELEKDILKKDFDGKIEIKHEKLVRKKYRHFINDEIEMH